MKILESLDRITSVIRNYAPLIPDKNDTTISATAKLLGLSTKLVSTISNTSTAEEILKKKNFQAVDSFFLSQFFYKIISTRYKFNQTNLHHSDDSKLCIYEFSIKDYGKLSFLIDKKSSGPYVYGSQVYYSDNFNFELFYNDLYKEYNNRINLHGIIKYGHFDDFTINSLLDNDEDLLFGETLNKFNLFNQKYIQYKKDSLSRAYLFVGEPGTGKTTFAYKLNDNLNGKILKIDSAIFKELEPEQFSLLFNYTDLLIIDDLDRIMDDELSYNLLSILGIARKKSNISIILIANDISKLNSALLRPGRVDQILEFNLPTEEDRKTILKEYAKYFGLDIDNDIGMFANLTAGMSGAYLREIVLQLKYNSVDDVVDTIDKMKEYSVKVNK